MEDQTPEDWLLMIGAARSLKQMFDSFCDAGFTDDQALRLVALIIIGHNTTLEKPEKPDSES